MPINESNNLKALKDALLYFYKETGNPITLEYVALNDFNDHAKDAANLVRFASHFPSKINIIEYNSIEQADFRKSDPRQLEKFASVLEGKGLRVYIRKSRGEDIDAACGQLANKEN